MRFQVVCAWCGEDLGTMNDEDTPGDNAIISHAICGPCKAMLKCEADRLNKSTNFEKGEYHERH